MKKPKWVYELHVPVTETWVFEVEAESEEEAWRLYQNHDPRVIQTCTLGGGSEGTDKIVKLRKA